MSDKLNRLAPTGNLDTDSDVRYVGKGDGRTGDTTQNRNTQIAGDAGSTSGDITPTLGNELAESLGSVSAQNKKYRVTVDGDATKSHSITFLSTKRDARITTGTGVNGEIEFNGTVGSLISAFQASNLSGAFLVQQNGNEVTFELTPYPSYQWYLDNNGVDDVSVICTQEAIPIDLAGDLKDIGSYDLLGDLFVFSTTQDNLPTETDLEVTAVGPIIGTNFTGPLTILTFNQDHNLQQRQWIRITNSNAPWLNGLFLVQGIPSSTQVQIVTDTAWGVSHPTAGYTVGNEVVTINPNGIGEIGVAQKNEDTESWEYIRLLRSVELNFVSKYAIDSQGEKDIIRTSVYFDDDYNPFRKFYYNEEYTLDGAITSVNPDGLYQYDNIGQLIFGHKTKPNVQINFLSQNPSGGVLESGNVRYFAVFKDVFGNESLATDLSNIVIVYSESQNGIAIGDDSGTVTSKSNNLEIVGINNTVFTEVALGYYRVIDGAYSAKLLDYVPVGGETTLITHTGLEVESNYDVANLIANKNDEYIFAKNIRTIDQRTVRSNLRKRDYTDLSEWFKTFNHRICVDKISETRPFPNDPAGEYKDPLNGFYKLGYMYNETYRMSGRIHLTDGSISDWFWVDDIRVDPFLNNQANPNDNRRIQTGADISTSFDLTENVGTDAYSHKRVLVPYIDFFGADLSASINGTPIQEIATYIEFGRADVVEEVIACGIAVSSVKIRLAKDNPSSVVANSDDLSISGINRGYPMGGRFGAVAAGDGNTHPEVLIGTGVRESDVDGETETYHEYPWAQGGAYCAMAASTSGQVPPNYTNENFVVTSNSPVDENFDNYIPEIEYPQVQGVDFYNTEFATAFQTLGSYATIPTNDFAFSSERRILSIYSPDILMGYSAGNSVSLIDFGEVLLDTTQFFTRGWRHSNQTNNTVILPSIATRYHSENLLDTYNQYEIDNAQFIEEGTRENLFGFTGFRKAYDAYRFKSQVGVLEPEKASWENLWNQKSGPVIYVENGGAGITQQGKNTDYGVRYVQLFTEKQDKYGSVENTNYYTTGKKFKIGEVNTVGVVQQGIFNVFGGDTFTQSSNLKTRIQNIGANPAGTDPETWGNSMVPDYGIGLGGAVIVYTQNRVNAQMRYDTDEQFINLKDTLNIGIWSWDWQQIDRDTYSQIYTPSNKGLGQVSGNFIGRRYTSDYPTRIHWSERKIYGELIDSFTNFLPLNIKDLNLKFGEINHHEDINGELFTVQPRKFQLQYFNARGTLQASSTSVEVLIGDGSVLSRDGQTLSSYGTEHKWSAIKGLSQSGKDVLYWFNAENGLMMRFGEDGTRVISDRGMIAFFSNFTKWVKNKHEHAFEQGVRGVWDDRRKEAIWTFTGWRNIPQWTNSTQIAVQATLGSVIANSNAPADTYEEFPRFFRCTVAHTVSSVTEPGVGSDWEDFWEQIPYTDYNYYSIFTICFNEQTNGFRCFYGHIPKTYLKWQNTFLSSHPTQRNLLFEHRKGEPTTWYGAPNYPTGAIPPKVEDAYFESVVNNIPEQSFSGVAVDVLSENAPDRTEYRTARQYTFDNAVDFEQRDDQFYSPIKNDATLTNNPDSDGEYLRGDFLKVKFFIFGGTYNLFHSIVVKIRETLRRTNT